MAAPDDDLPPLASRSGLVPPDGQHWPPRPAGSSRSSRAQASAAAELADAHAASRLAPTPRRPAGSDVEDWRAMPTDAPDGYLGSAAAPRPVPRWDPYSVTAIAMAVVGLGSYFSAPVSPASGLLGVALGLVGRRATGLDPSLRGRTLATAAIVLALVMPVYHGIRLATGTS